MLSYSDGREVVRSATPLDGMIHHYLVVESEGEGTYGPVGPRINQHTMRISRLALRELGTVVSRHGEVCRIRGG